MQYFVVLRLYSFEKSIVGVKDVRVVEGPKHFLPVFEDYREAVEWAGDRSRVLCVEVVDPDEGS